MPKTTPAQRLAKIFATFIHQNTPDNERTTAGRHLDAELKRQGKTRADIPAILVQAATDDAAAQPPPPPSDPRDTAGHPFDSPEFNPASLVEDMVSKYVTMSEHVRVIISLWVPFTHVYTQFAIAPRIAVVSESPKSGKSTLRKVVRPLVCRPNRGVLASSAVLKRFLDRGPCTILLDELDYLSADARKQLQLMWNLGHERDDSETSLLVGGKETYFKQHAPMLAAGMGNFLEPTQESRTFKLELEQYTEKTKPECDYNTDFNVKDFDAVYSYLCNWARTAKLNPKPRMPAGVIGRPADDARGLLSIADFCEPEWGRRARDAILSLLEKEKSEQPKITIVRHGLIIFDRLDVSMIGSIRFNRELKQLDLPDARWTRYRGPSGIEYAHPIEIHEQAALLKKVSIESEKIRPPGENQCHGYKRAQFEAAKREHDPVASGEAEPARERLRLDHPVL